MLIRGNWKMGKGLLLLSLIGMLWLGLTACNGAEEAPGGKLDANTKWADVLEMANGKTVQIHMWGGSDSINRYMDEWVAPRLKDQFAVTLKRVPVNDAKEFINPLLTERKVAADKSGTIDIIWINGENFKTAKENKLLWDSFASRLPNAQSYIDLQAADLAYDFGLATDGYEAPWGKAQFVFIHDEAKTGVPPRSMQALLTWVEANPGRFTYPAPPDFTGSAFIRHALYELAGGHEAYLKDLTEAQFLRLAEPLWPFLNELEPYLWRKGETYPENLAKLDQLYTNGEVWMSMGYDPARAANAIKNKTFPASTRTFVLDKGTLSNTHYLAIPFNAPEPAAAMVTINYLLSPEAQIAKSDPANWGEDTVLSLDKLPAADRDRLQAIDRGAATLSAAELASHRVPEMPATYVEWLEKAWTENVANR